jgi:protein-tyrosine phosphatase
MFRRVDLPARVPGRLLLHSMPGRFEAIESVWRQLRNEKVHAIVCLTEKYEIRLKSSKYAEALESGTVPCSVLPFEIREGGVPENQDAFWALANDVANRLQSGEAVLIHCAGGVGRTAMLAVSVLIALGESINEAESVVSRAGSIVETTPQIEMLSWCASKQAGLRPFKSLPRTRSGVQSSRFNVQTSERDVFVPGGAAETRHGRDRFKKDKG